MLNSLWLRNLLRGNGTDRNAVTLKDLDLTIVLFIIFSVVKCCLNVDLMFTQIVHYRVD